MIEIKPVTYKLLGHYLLIFLLAVFLGAPSGANVPLVFVIGVVVVAVVDELLSTVTKVEIQKDLLTIKKLVSKIDIDLRTLKEVKRDIWRHEFGLQLFDGRCIKALPRYSFNDRDVARLRADLTTRAKENIQCQAALRT